MGFKTIYFAGINARSVHNALEEWLGKEGESIDITSHSLSVKFNTLTGWTEFFISVIYKEL